MIYTQYVGFDKEEGYDKYNHPSRIRGFQQHKYNTVTFVCIAP